VRGRWGRERFGFVHLSQCQRKSSGRWWDVGSVHERSLHPTTAPHTKRQSNLVIQLDLNVGDILVGVVVELEIVFFVFFLVFVDFDLGVLIDHAER
jgi:hypothetical protein